MGFYYSASAGGFFHDELHPQLPADAVPIGDDRHRELLNAQASGKAIEADPNGLPVARAPSVPIAARRARAVMYVKSEARRRIDLAAPIWRQLNAMRSDAGATDPIFGRIDAIRAASNAIEATISKMAAAELEAFQIPSDPSLARLKGTIMTEPSLHTSIGDLDTDRRDVPVTFTYGEIVHARRVNACYNSDGLYDEVATLARVNDVGRGVLVKIAVGAIVEPSPPPAEPQQ